MTDFHIEVDFSDVRRELDRLGSGPGMDTRKRLAALIASGFAATQAVVHIVTGSLRTSGKDSTDWDGARWEGEISYGGDAIGAVNNPVWYAQIEQERVAGGATYKSHRGWMAGANAQGHRNIDHDFMWPLDGTDHLYGEVVLQFLRGDAR